MGVGMGFGSGRGKVGQAVRRAIVAARRREERGETWQIRAGMAEWTADLVDSCVKSSDGARFLAASKRLDDLLVRLGLDAELSGDCAGWDEGDPTSRLAALMGSAPTLGDSEDAV